MVQQVNNMTPAEMFWKLEFWTKRYEFVFQLWGSGKNNVYISRDDVEVTSFGDEESIQDIYVKTIQWCEKSNPRIKYK